MLTIKIPQYCEREQYYILEIMFGEFLGLTYRVETCEGSYIEITNNDDNFKLTIDASFFIKAERYWIRPQLMPSLPLEYWKPSDDGLHCNLVIESVPVLYGRPGLIKNGRYLHLNLDIFGGSFFLLTRVEELITKDRDGHNRFPGWASIAHKANFLERPLVDEYLEILWQSLKHFWPELKLKNRTASNFITCDLDWPFDPVRRSFKKTILKSAADIFKRKNIKEFIFSWKHFLFHSLGLNQKDSYRDSIDWIMDVNEKAGNKVAFYFIAKSTSSLDTDFDFLSEEVQHLLKKINSRGHEIGIHPGYNCFNNENNFEESLSVLKGALDHANIKQDIIGGRMHFLRWDVMQTPHLWESCQLDYDSTLSFADYTGFRCGTSHSFTMFDLVNRKPFKIKQCPLINMECTIIAERYEGKGYSEASKKRFLYFKELTRKYNGTYTLLWHNSHFTNLQDKEFYKELIQ